MYIDHTKIGERCSADQTGVNMLKINFIHLDSILSRYVL